MLNTNSYIGKELGNYRVTTKIASGGFATVFKGKHLILTERIVAIKILHTYLDLKEQGDQFLREAQLLEKLKHHYILPIFDVGLNEGFPYLVTEYASNGSLRDRLNQQAPSLRPPQESLTILSQIGQALQHAHQQNVVHRDLKPENILFNANNEALLADFGIATVLSTVNKSNATVIGTPAYMAPEQFQGIISKKSDQYALGCIAYELFTGHKPFKASNFAAFMFKHLTENPIAPTQLNPQLPIYIEQAILKAMAKEPGNRHTDISAFVTALYTPNISRTPVSTRNVPISEKSNKQSSKFKKHLDAANADENATPHIPLDSANSAERREAVKSLAQTDHLTKQKTKEQWVYEARTFGTIGRSVEALAACDQAIRLDPNYTEAYAYMSSALCELRRYEEALAVCKQAIRLDPNNIMAYINMGTSLQGLGRYEEALAVYNQTIGLDLTCTIANNNKAVVLGLLGRYKEALEASEQAIRLDPTCGRTYHLKGAALLGLRRYGEASRAFDQATSFGFRDSIHTSTMAQEMTKISQARRMGLAFVGLFAVALVLYLILPSPAVLQDNVLDYVFLGTELLGAILAFFIWIWVISLAHQRGQIGWVIFLFFLSYIAVPLYLILNPLPEDRHNIW